MCDFELIVVLFESISRRVKITNCAKSRDTKAFWKVKKQIKSCLKFKQSKERVSTANHVKKVKRQSGQNEGKNRLFYDALRLHASQNKKNLSLHSQSKELCLELAQFSKLQILLVEIKLFHISYKNIVRFISLRKKDVLYGSFPLKIIKRMW